MIVDLYETEQNILARLGELCDQYNFQRKAHPGSLASLGEVINNVTALVRFKADKGDRPKNLTAGCINQISELQFEIHVVYIDYRGHHKIYELAKLISDKLRGCRDLITFCPGVKDTQHYSYVEDFRFLEVDGNDRACFSYSFDLVIPYSETYKNKR